MKITALAISKTDWKNQTISVVVQQTKDSARKILKGIDISIERKRFNNSCRILEKYAIQKGVEIKILEAKIQEILDKSTSDFSVLLPFVELDKLKAIKDYFDGNENKKLLESNAAIVFVVDEYSFGNININLRDNKRPEMLISNIHEFNQIDTNKIEQRRFDEQILYALTTGDPIGWINIELVRQHENKSETTESKAQFEAQKLLRHEGLIACLREHVYAAKQPTVIREVMVDKSVVDEEANEEREKSFGFKIANLFIKQSTIMKTIKVKQSITEVLEIIPRKIQFAFEDGSISDYFPLYSMVEIVPNENLQVIKVALISNRHFELDSIVETCIIRNSEISRLEEATIAQQEKLSFEKAEAFFTEVLEKTQGVHIELYHTGLEPAVIGTYRAFLKKVLEKNNKGQFYNRGKLIITPKIKRGEEYDSLKKWY